MTKTNWIDIEKLKQELDFERVLRFYGVEPRVKGEQHHGFCPLPLHNGKKNSPSFSANLKRGIWQCFGCGRHGNILDFAVLMDKGDPKNGKDVQATAAKLWNEFLTGFAKADIHSPSIEEDVRTNVPLDFELKGLDIKHPYLFSRGFNQETIERFGLGYCTRGLLQGRIAIPIHDGEKRLVGYAGRIVDDSQIAEDNPKYKFPGRRERDGVIYEFSKSLLLYNAHRINGPVDDLIVVEGFPSVWWLRQAGLADVVSPMGASCSKKQGEAIVSLVKPTGHVWIFTDDDQAGERCAHDVFEQVGGYRFVKRLLFKDAVQPTDVAARHLEEFWRWRHA